MHMAMKICQKSRKTHLGVTIKRALIEAMDVTEVTLHIYIFRQAKKNNVFLGHMYSCGVKPACSHVYNKKYHRNV